VLCSRSVEDLDLELSDAVSVGHGLSHELQVRDRSFQLREHLLHLLDPWRAAIVGVPVHGVESGSPRGTRGIDERLDRLERQVEELSATVGAQAVTIKAQAAEIVVLKTENAELKRRLGENSSNSSKPPSSDSPADRHARPKDAPSGNPRGGQRGHKGHKRTFLPANRVRSSTDCFPPQCRRCGDALPKRRDADPVRHQVVDIPKIEPAADDYWLHRVTCSCGETTCGTLPTGVPQGMLGVQVLALIAVLTADGHMSRRKVQSLLATVFGLEVSLGTLSESEQIVSDAVAPAVEEARIHALAEKVKYVDATTWYQAGAYRSLWTLATASVTVFAIVADGTRETLRLWIDRIRGVLVTDRGSQFGFWAMERRLICWAHLIRKFAAFSELRGPPARSARICCCGRKSCCTRGIEFGTGPGHEPTSGPLPPTSER
jgi:outer membrane murein-binding lipoprotein Lpp